MLLNGEFGSEYASVAYPCVVDQPRFTGRSLSFSFPVHVPCILPFTSQLVSKIVIESKEPLSGTLPPVKLE